MSLIADLLSSFVLGLLTPLTAVCVLPLYPGFIAYLSNKFTGNESRKNVVLFGLIVVSGLILFMLLLGLVFSFILQVSLTKVIGVISPIAFTLLAVISLFLIFNFDLGKFFPKFKTPTSKNPLKNAFLFGFFFGAIVIPCNPAFIAALFLKTTTANFFINLLNFLFFGLGIGAPLLVLSIVSATKSNLIIGFLLKHKRKINLIAGLGMLIASLYYLIFVFKIFG